MKTMSFTQWFSLIILSLGLVSFYSFSRAETAKDELMSYQFQVLDSNQLIGMKFGAHGGVGCSVSHAEGKETARSAHLMPGETYYVTKINGRESFGADAETKAMLSFNIESLDSEGSYIILCHNKKDTKISLSEIESALKQKLEMRKI